MPDRPSTLILKRLRTDPEALDEFVNLGVDHLLQSPIDSLLDPTWLAAAMTTGLRDSVQDPNFERWIQARLSDAGTQTRKFTGPLAEKLPMTVLAPLERAVGRPFVPDPTLVRTVLDHPSLRELLREILHENLTIFAGQLRSAVPDRAARRAGSLPGIGLAARLAKGVAAVVGGEVERQLEGRVSSFVNEVLGHAVEMAVSRISSTDHAQEMAKWRIDVLHAVLKQPVEDLLAEPHNYPPDLIAADISAILRAFAGWSDLETLIEESLRALIDIPEKPTLGSWLEGSGLEKAWRPQFSEALHRQATQVVETEAFTRWLRRVADP